MAKFYKLPLETLLDLHKQEFLFTAQHWRTFTDIAQLDLSCDALGEALLALCHHNAALEMRSPGADETCRSGAKQALHDILALIAARPARDQTDIAHKILNAELVSGEQPPHLYWMMQASIRCDIAAIMSDWPRERFEAWIENRRRHARR